MGDLTPKTQREAVTASVMQALLCQKPFHISTRPRVQMFDRVLRSGEKIFKMKYKQNGNSKSMLLYKRTVDKEQHLSTA